MSTKPKNSIDIDRENEVKNEIEILRSKLNGIGVSLVLISENVLKISEDLDVKIVEYMRMNKNKS